MSDRGAPVNGRLRRIRDRHFDCYLDLAAAAEEATGGDRVYWSEVLESEIANIRSALEWGLASERPEVAALAAALEWYWIESRRLAEARQLLDRALRHPHLPVSGRVDALRAAGELAWAHRDLAGSRERYEASRQLAASAGERHRQARAATGLGWACYALSLTQAAVDAFTEALELSDHLSPGEQAYALSGFAWTNVLKGDNDAARQLLRDARRILEETGDPHLTAHYVRETTLLVQLGYPEEAMVLADKAIALARAGSGNLIFALIAKDKAAEALGDAELLRRAVDEGIELTNAAGESKWEARFQGRLADHAVMQGDIGTARGAVDRGLRLLDHLPDMDQSDVQIRAGLLAVRANLAEDDGDLDVAEELRRQIIEGYRDTSPRAYSLALAALARLLAGHGDSRRGRLALMQAIAAVDHLEHDHATDARIQLALLDEDLEGALRLDTDSLPEPWRNGHAGIRAWGGRRASLLAGLGRFEEAGAVLDEVIEAGGASEGLHRARAHVDRARVRIALADADGARSDLLESAGFARLGWAADQLFLASTLTRFALLEGRGERAVEIWAAVVGYRSANRRVCPPVSRGFEEPLRQLPIGSARPPLDSRTELDALRSLVSEEFGSVIAKPNG